MSNLGKTLFLSFSVGLISTGFSIIFPIFPKILENFGGGAFELGLLAAVYGVSYTIFSPIFGSKADEIGKNKVILIGLLGFIFSNAFFIIARGMALLIIGRIVEGIFSASIFPAAISIVTDFSDENNTAKYVGYLTAGNTIGIIIGPMLGGLLYNISLYAPFYLSILLAIINLLLSLKYMPESRAVILDDNMNMNKMSWSEKISVFPKPLWVFGIYAIIDTIGVLTWMLVEPGFSFYIYDVLNLTPTDFGYFIASYGLSMAIFQGFFGSLSDKYGRRRIIFIGLSLNTLFYLLLLNSTTTMMLVISAIIAGIGLGMLTPAMKALITEVSRSEYKTTILGTESGIVGLSIIVGPLLGGYLYEILNIESLIMISVYLGLLSMLLTLLLKFNKQ